jgi:hypothetical protein
MFKWQAKDTGEMDRGAETLGWRADFLSRGVGVAGKEEGNVFFQVCFLRRIGLKETNGRTRRK